MSSTVKRESSLDAKLYPLQIALSGKLITAYDSTKLVMPGERNLLMENFKVLKNMRYTDNGIQGIGGMTKINTTTPTNLKFRNIYQFIKNSVGVYENYVFTQAWNNALNASVVYRNQTAIPNQGNFDAATFFTDSSGAGTGRFSDAPQGHMIYCNGVNMMSYGGNEQQVSSFVIYDPNGSFSKDFTSVVQNTATDSTNIATIKNSPAGNDANVMTLLHCNGADGSTTFTDSSTSAHVFTAVGAAQLKTSTPKFGTAAGYCGGVNDWITTPDHADYNFNGGNVTLEGWFNVSGLAADRGLMGQGTDAERYWQFYVASDGSVKLKILTSPSTVWAGLAAKALTNAVIPTVANGFFYECTVAGTTAAGEPAWPVIVGNTVVDGTVTWTCRKVVNITYSTATGVISTGSYNHIEFDESGDTKYIFVNGTTQAYYSDSNRIADMLTNVFYIGAVNGAAKPYYGYFDEVRISNVARHTADFEVPASEYTTTTQICSIRIGNTMPISGIKIYVKNANAAASSVLVYRQSGNNWALVSGLVDGTSVAGASLAQTGTISFTGTPETDTIGLVGNVAGYYYKLEFSGVTETTTISYVSLVEPIQILKDFWDGVPRKAASVQLFKNGAYQNNTLNVFEDRYVYDESVGGDTSSYMTMDSLATSTDSLTIGFSQRIMGLQFKFIPRTATKTHVNTTTNTLATVQYNNGIGWVTVGMIQDGTQLGGISAGQSGYVTWTPLAENVEFIKSINGGDSLYQYKIQWSATFSADVKCYYISGIPIPKKLGVYNFSLQAQNSLWLFDNTIQDRNKAIISQMNTFNVFNGKAAGDPLFFGNSDPVVAATEHFVRYTSSVSSTVLIGKKAAMYIIDGDTPDTRKIIKLSGEKGVIAPLTLKSSGLGLEYLPLQAYQVSIWQSSDGIYMYNGTTILPISDSIKNYFDPKKSESINLSVADKSIGFFDNVLNEYHWCFASGSSATLNKELVFDMRRQKWYEIDRNTNYLQCGANVRDSTGNSYTYGCVDTGYIVRLENGTDFISSNIISEFQIPDIAVYQGNILYETRIRNVELPQVSKTVTTNLVQATHYGDGNNTGTAFTLSPKNVNARINIPVAYTNLGNFVFHSINFKLTTNNETVPFEPLFLGIDYDVIRRKGIGYG